jgi:hypothetical protein
MQSPASARVLYSQESQGREVCYQMERQYIGLDKWSLLGPCIHGQPFVRVHHVKLKKSCKDTAHNFSYMSCPKLPWKLYQLLLGRTLMIAEYLGTMKSVWQISQFRHNRYFSFWSLVPYRYTSADLFRQIVSINLIKFVTDFFDKITFCVLGPIWRAPIFWAGIFIFTLYQLVPMTD